MSLRLVRAARIELDHAVDWYEEQQPGLGDEFLTEVERSLALIAGNPDAWRVWPGEPRARMFLMRRFPYVIAYRAIGDDIIILAFAHARRRPGYWRARLDET